MPLSRHAGLVLVVVLAAAGGTLAPGRADASHTPFAAALPIPKVLDGVVEAPGKLKPTSCQRRAKRIRSSRKRRAALRRCQVVRRKRVRRCRRRAARRIKAPARRRAALRRCSRRQRTTIRRRGPIRLEMKEAEIQILPGKKTRMWTYNGSFPGPTIRVPSGSPQTVEVRNNLPASAGSMSVHRHGGHQASADDGQPMDHLIAPGASRTYNYPLTAEGKPEPAAFEWYHDHRDQATARNVWRGLAGMFIVDDELDRQLNLPSGEYDVPLMIADRSFDADNQLTNPFPENGPASGTAPPNDQVVGDHILVNSAPQPHFDVADRRYRLRLLNASNFRSYELRLSNDEALTQIATESGLLPAPVNRRSIVLGPAERAEVVVDFAGKLGEEVVLASSAGPVMQFRVNRHVERDDSSVRFDTLRPAAPVDAPALPTRTWNFDFTPLTASGTSAWTINGQAFDHERVDARPPMGATETWRLTNPSTVRHLVHIHNTDARVLTRNGAEPPPWEAGPKETFLLDPGDIVDVAVRFTDHSGRFVMHCHMLEHEDNGMMNQFEVVGPGGAAGHGGPRDRHAAPATWGTLLSSTGGVGMFAPLALLIIGGLLIGPGQRLAARFPSRDEQPVGTPVGRRVGALLLGGVALTHLLAFPHKLEAPYMAAMFAVCIVAAPGLALLLAAGRRTRLAWGGSLLLGVTVAAGYVGSRSVGLPQIEHDVGNWLDPFGAMSLFFVTGLAGLAASALTPLAAPARPRFASPGRRAVAVAIEGTLLLCLLLTAAPAAAQSGGGGASIDIRSVSAIAPVRSDIGPRTMQVNRALIPNGYTVRT